MDSSSASVQVVHNPASNRFEVRLGDQLAKAEYMRAGEKIVFTHTEVPESQESQGIGSQLARAALDYARDEGLVVVPLCPFIAAYIRRHDAYRPLVLEGFKL